MGPLSVLVADVFVWPPQAATHIAIAIRPMAATCFGTALLIEPPPR
jgi:hypothetical protein